MKEEQEQSMSNVELKFIPNDEEMWCLIIVTFIPGPLIFFIKLYNHLFLLEQPFSEYWTFWLIVCIVISAFISACAGLAHRRVTLWQHSRKKAKEKKGIEAKYTYKEIELITSWRMILFKLIACFLVIIGFLNIIYVFVCKNIYSDITFDLDKLKALGGFLAGTSGVLWSLAAMVVVYLAFIRQHYLLIVQEKQIERNDIQLFEHTFFNQIDLHNRIVDSMKVDFGKNHKFEVKGKNCFKRFYEDFKSKIPESDSEINKCLEVFGKILERYECSLELYFRNLYHILKMLDLKSLNENIAKKTYSNIIRAQLSSHELVLLFYDVLYLEKESNKHGKQHKELIEQFSLLHHLKKELLIDEDHEKEYDSNAYDWSKENNLNCD